MGRTEGRSFGTCVCICVRKWLSSLVRERLQEQIFSLCDADAVKQQVKFEERAIFCMHAYKVIVPARTGTFQGAKKSSSCCAGAVDHRMHSEWEAS